VESVGIRLLLIQPTVTEIKPAKHLASEPAKLQLRQPLASHQRAATVMVAAVEAFNRPDGCNFSCFASGFLRDAGVKRGKSHIIGHDFLLRVAREQNGEWSPVVACRTLARSGSRTTGGSDEGRKTSWRPVCRGRF